MLSNYDFKKETMTNISELFLTKNSILTMRDEKNEFNTKN